MSEQHDDPYFRLYAFGIGRVLSEQDVADIQQVLKDYNDEMEAHIDVHQLVRIETLREIGGSELIAAVEAKDEAIVRAAVAKALARFEAAFPQAPQAQPKDERER